MGLTLTVDGISAAVGDLVEVNPGDRGLLAEVVAVGRDRLTCMPLGNLSGVHSGAPVRATGTVASSNLAAAAPRAAVAEATRRSQRAWTSSIRSAAARSASATTDAAAVIPSACA